MAKTIHRPEYAVLRNALRDLRIQRGVTQAQLADALGRAQPSEAATKLAPLIDCDSLTPDRAHGNVSLLRKDPIPP